jgi:hypothetical protein
LNFEIDIDENTKYAPIMLASAIGDIDILNKILLNPNVDINVKD